MSEQVTTQRQPTNYEQVYEFHKMFGHPIALEPQLNIFDENPELVQFRISQIEEEFAELNTALEKKDFIECIDAICDLMYFVYGSFLAFGLNFDAYEPKPKVRNFNCPQNNIDIFKTDTSGLQTQMSMLTQALSLISLSAEEKNFAYMIKFFAKLEAVCRSIATLLGVDINVCFAEVHRSNMTKLCLTEEIATRTVADYVQKKITRDTLLEGVNDENTRAKIMEEYKAYDDPDFRYDGVKYWIVYDKATTKILKSIDFEKPRLASVIGLDLTAKQEQSADDSTDMVELGDGTDDGDDVDDTDDGDDVVDNVDNVNDINESEVLMTTNNAYTSMS